MVVLSKLEEFWLSLLKHQALQQSLENVMNIEDVEERAIQVLIRALFLITMGILHEKKKGCVCCKAEDRVDSLLNSHKPSFLFRTSPENVNLLMSNDSEMAVPLKENTNKLNVSPKILAPDTPVYESTPVAHGSQQVSSIPETANMDDSYHNTDFFISAYDLKTDYEVNAVKTPVKSNGIPNASDISSHSPVFRKYSSFSSPRTTKISCALTSLSDCVNSKITNTPSPTQEKSNIGTPSPSLLSSHKLLNKGREPGTHCGITEKTRDVKRTPLKRVYSESNIGKLTINYSEPRDKKIFLQTKISKESFNKKDEVKNNFEKAIYESLKTKTKEDFLRANQYSSLHTKDEADRLLQSHKTDPVNQSLVKPDSSVSPKKRVLSRNFKSEASVSARNSNNALHNNVPRQRVADSYDSPPAEIDREKGLRKRNERRQLEGWACKECEDFYGGKPEYEKKECLKTCSRHRSRYNPLHNTPKDFWHPEWID